MELCNYFTQYAIGLALILAGIVCLRVRTKIRKWLRDLRYILLILGLAFIVIGAYVIFVVTAVLIVGVR